MSWVGTGTPIPTSSRWSGASRNDRLRNGRARRHVQYGTFARGRGGRMQARVPNTAPEKAEADALILPIFEGQPTAPAEAPALGKKLKGAPCPPPPGPPVPGRSHDPAPPPNPR